MKIAIIGATGHAGSRIASEALRRGHSVTGIVRTPEKAGTPSGMTLVKGDATDPQALASVLRGHDVVVSAARFQSLTAQPLIEAAQAAGVKRLFVVGGAASLETAPGRSLLDTPGFPEAYKPEASAGTKFLADLRSVQTLDWTFLSPSGEFAPGERTGRFRVGGDQLLVAPDGRSRISMEDYAIAALDELEQPKHPRQRFTVGY
jgi:putative NADH-flavin reductase